MITPDTLSPGDRVAIIAPASPVRPDYIDGAVSRLEAEGFAVQVMPHAKGPSQGSYAAADADRLADLLNALQDPGVKAILCARGGYGCNHLLHRIPPAMIAANPKWLIGFSDISALHALWQSAGVISLHAPMAKHLTLLPPDHYCTAALMKLLKEGLPLGYTLPTDPRSRCGEAVGRLTGGNLAVINGLAATPYDPLKPNNEPQKPDDDPKILFIEDIAEKIYAVERMLTRIILTGAMQQFKALIVGHFTEYTPDRNHKDMETMIIDLLNRYNLTMPVVFGFPAGHTDDNLPLPLGAEVRLSITPELTHLTTI